MKNNRILSTIYLLLMGIVMTFAQGVNVLRIPDVVIPRGNTKDLTVELENSADVVAVEFVLTLADKVTIPSTEALTLSERCDGHVYKYSSLGNNKYKVMVYSSENKPFTGNAGKLLTLKVSADESLEDGTEFPMALENVVIGKKDGTNIMTGISAGKIKIMNPCDLTVDNVNVRSSEFTPGTECNVSWTVKNIGGKPTEAGWREDVFLYALDNVKLSKLVSTSYYEGILGNGSSLDRDVKFTLDNIVGLDGNVGIKVKLTPYYDAGEPDGFRINNENVLSGKSVEVKPVLMLSPTEKNVDEGINPTWTYLLKRSGRNDFDETFTITATEDLRVKLPESVTIYAGSSGASFTVSVEANQMLDAIMTVGVAIGNDKYGNTTANINIEDDTDPTLTITSAQQEVMENGTINLTIATNRLTKTDVKVTLGCDMPSRFNIPSDIIIPSGESSVEVRVDAIDNETPDIEQVVRFSAAAERHVAGSFLTTLIDNDMPALTLVLTPSALSEDAGPMAVTAKLSRSNNIDKKVTIKISDDSNGGIYYTGQTVDLPAGVSEKTISLGPIDNTEVDGERTVNITAAVYVSACSCNASNGTYGGVVTAPLTIFDNDGPTLSFNKSSSVLKEGDEMYITIKRNSTSTEALTITLTTDHPGELEIPNAVTIESGKSETTFTVKSTGNEIQGDDFMAQIIAEAVGYSKTNIWFTVTDQSLADAQLTDISFSATQVEAGGKVTLTVELTNTGNYPVPEMTTVTVHHGDGTTQMYLQENLDPGMTTRFSKEIFMPNMVGTFNVYAVANENKKTEELSYTNNASDIVKITTTTPYTAASVSVGKTIYEVGETFDIIGKLQGVNISNRNVEVYIINEGVRNVVNVVSDESGLFKATYTPMKGQMGHFSIGACFASENLKTEMAGVDICGLRRTDAEYVKCETLVGDAYDGKISIVNPGFVKQTGMSVNVASKPDNCEVVVNVPQTLSGGQTGDVTFTITPTSASSGTDWEPITMNVRSAEGAELSLTIYNYSRVKTATLKASIATIETTMTKGKVREYPFDIKNIGNGATGKITLDLPSWMATSTPREIASIAGGETTGVVLALSPTDEMSLNIPVKGVIGINCENGVGLALPFSIEPVSESTGTLTIDVCDEYTYNTATQPHLANATVKVLHPTTGEEISKGITDINGLFKVEIPEGIYRIDVDADKHDSYRNNKVVVSPAMDNKLTVNLSCQPIVVKWNVTETAVEDVYDITTTMEFETSVPVPQVKLEMPNRVPAEELNIGESLIFYASLTNVGLITAEDVQFFKPEGFNNLVFEQLAYNEPFDLAPQQNVMIPVKVTRIDPSSAKAKGSGRAVPIDNDPCIGYPGTLYYWDCGLDRKWHRYGIALQLGTCRSNDPNTWGGGAGSGGGNNSYGFGWGGLGCPSSVAGSPYFSNTENQSLPRANTTEDCEPCQNRFLLRLVDCGLQVIPIYRTLKGVLDCATSVWHLANIASSGNPTLKQIAFGALSSTMACSSAVTGLGGADDPEAIEALLDQILSTIDDISRKLAESQPGDTFEDVFDLDFYVDEVGALAGKLAALAGFNDELVERLLCPVKLLEPCDLEGSEAQVKSMGVKTARSAGLPDYVHEFQKTISLPLACNLSLISIRQEIFNEVSWQSSNEDQLNVFLESLQYAMDENGVIAEDKIDAVITDRPENISVNMAKEFIDRWNATVTGVDGGFDLEKIQGYFNVIEKSEQQIHSMGYESVADCYERAYEKVSSEIEKSSSVCASITLQLSQQMVMTRQAFRGTLSIYNGHETKPLQDVKLNLNILDDDGNIASSSEFQINPEQLEGFTGNMDLTSGWSLAAQEEGVATVLFIPTKNAAPVTSKIYHFGGSVTYLDPFTNLEVTRVLMPVALTVKPSPILDLTYFVQRDVIGDDPLTERVEPSQDAEFALLVNNVGYGDATDVRMVTQQPQVIRNDKGLAIDFEIVSSQLNGGEKDLAMGSSITTEFGNIPAKTQAYAQWWLRSSLLGHFIDYKVEANHASSYDNPDLSLLNEVTVHELIRSITVGDEGDRKVGFLVNSLKNGYVPDRIFLTDGTEDVVNPVVSASMRYIGENAYEITINPTTTGWNYGNIIDPTYGVSKIKSITRNGKTISLRNFWLTDRTLRDGEDPIYENRIHFADNFESTAAVTYFVEFESAPSLPLDIVQIEGVPTGIAETPVDFLNVVFNKRITESSFTREDITLCVQGEKLIEDIAISTNDEGKTFTLDFSQLNQNAGNGYYTMIIHTDGITDNDGYAGRDGKSVSWTLFKDGLVKFVTKAYPENSGLVEKTYFDASANVKSKFAATIANNEETAIYGKKVKLTSKPAVGYEFKNWTQKDKVLSEESSLIVNAIGDMSITANFVKKKYQIDVDSEYGGTVEGSLTGIYSHGDDLTIKAIPDEEYKFVRWMVDDKDAGSIETLKLTVEKAISVKAIFERSVFEQKVTSSSGWNWVSTYIQEPLPVASLPYITRIISQFDENILDPEYGMIGSIENIMPGLGYKINAYYTFLKSVRGELYDTEIAPLLVHPGYNWISYPYYEERSLNVIANANNGDCIRSLAGGFAEFSNGGWTGTLTKLTPGQGYIYKSANEKNLEFNFFTSSTTRAKGHLSSEPSQTTKEIVDIHKYPNTMDITAQLFFDGNEMVGEDFVIYAMAGNECRGISKYVNGRYYLTVHGEDAVNITFLVENGFTGDSFISDKTIAFIDGLVGNFSTPYSINVRNTTGIDRIFEGGRKLPVYTVEGILVAPEATMETLKKLPSGVYIIDGCKYVVE